MTETINFELDGDGIATLTIDLPEATMNVVNRAVLSDLSELVKTVTEDIFVVIDTDWRPNYHGRTLHPESEAELARLDKSRVLELGKHIEAHENDGEFFGLAYLTKKAALEARKVFEQIEKKFDMEHACRCSDWCNCWEHFKRELKK